MLSSTKASPGLIIRFVSYRKAWYHSTYNIVISSRKRGVFPYIYQSIIAQGSLKDLTFYPFLVLSFRVVNALQIVRTYVRISFYGTDLLSINMLMFNRSIILF